MNQRPEIKTPLPGPRAAALIERDARFASTSLIKEYPLAIERGQGSWVWDVDGNKFLDFMAGIATTSTGHAHPEVVRSIQKAAEKFLHICATDFYYSAYTDLIEKLCSYVPKMGPKRAFLSNSGTEAVEGAIKLARYHTRRQNIIAFKGAFHGRTYGSLSLNGSKTTQRAFFGPMLPGITHVPYPYPYRCPYGQAKAQCESSCGCATPIEKELFVNFMDPKEVAAIILEPVMGEGGYIQPPKNFLQDLRRICDTHGIVLIFDEIQSGVGRTGHMFAAEMFDVAPDMLLVAKGIASGMPIGAFVVREKFMTWPPGSHGSTYGGNPVCAEAAIATLNIVEKLLPHVREAGAFMKQSVERLAEKYPVIGDVRGSGFMIGVEFVDPKTRAPAEQLCDEIVQRAFRKGLLLLGAGKSTIRLAPPLVLTKDEITTGLGIMEECLRELV
jgi:4-aminobutyrate aminotransferase